MARRMIAVLERNKVFSDPNHKKWKRATLAATLLHDVGHGPYSHVFEEVTEPYVHGKSHEEYTSEIIRKTEIAKILDNAGVLSETASFFDKEDQTPYRAIVSSQLDADRLDFLSRDRYFTGIRFGHIDLEWLFDSLRIEQVQSDFDSSSKRPMFVVEQKGLGVVEEYLLSYINLYESVYLHKTTRGFQFLIQLALSSAFEQRAELTKAGIDSPIFRYLDNPSLELYLHLDDYDILNLIKLLATQGKGDAKKFASRFLNRNPLKCFEPNDPNSVPNHEKTGLLIQHLKEKEIWHHEDIPQAKGYKQYEIMEEHYLKNILIKIDKTTKMPLGQLRPWLVRNTGKRFRLYFKTETDRQKAIKFWAKVS